MITALAGVIDARVDLSRPDRILLVEIFDDRVALAVLTPSEEFSVVKAREEAAGGAEPGGPPRPSGIGVRRRDAREAATADFRSAHPFLPTDQIVHSGWAHTPDAHEAQPESREDGSPGRSG
jgi:hypothetical protein